MYELRLPKWGQVMEEATVVEWFKQDGDAIAQGDVVVEVETDKANGSVESEVAGRLAEICAGQGATVEVGAVLCLIDEDAA